MQAVGKVQIVYADTEIVIVNKPGGLLSVPGKGSDKVDSVATRLRMIFSDMIDQPAVHRLDMYTTGLMVYARTREAHRNLSIQFEKRSIQKKYIAVVERRLTRNSGKICLPFRLDVNNRPLQIYDPVQGKTGITLWKKLSCDSSTSRIEFAPLTGRTHQLRVHSAHRLGLHAPIVGDSLYGSGSDGDDMLLCAVSLGLLHPESKRWMRFDLAPNF